jgi:hypothetical protein
MGRDPYGKIYSGYNAARRHKELNDQVAAMLKCAKKSTVKII